MSVCLVSGSAGLIGSESVRHFSKLGMDVVGVDNDMRCYFFGQEASTKWNLGEIQKDVKNYHHHDADIRNTVAIEQIFSQYGKRISLVIHTAAQPSHDWAAKEPHTDFGVNALGTLNMLEATRKYAPEAAFIFTSTNKVYGDAPNELPLCETPTRWELDPSHAYQKGVPESLRIDQSKHSLFGASKVAADIMVQEYGRYFGMKTVCFRGGCLTGPSHSGTELHGFLAYLMKCTATGLPYRVYGYKGKQVRDNIHSHDLIRAFECFYLNPKSGAVYNMGGGRKSNCSMLEAIVLCEEIAGRKLNYQLLEDNRIGDHIWYISDLTAFRRDYPAWDIDYTVPIILRDIYGHNRERWKVV
ncbi:MAG: NAD-dependent epimerase/dehydratase family protein [Phycisphaerae bacterium]